MQIYVEQWRDDLAKLTRPQMPNFLSKYSEDQKNKRLQMPNFLPKMKYIKTKKGHHVR